MEDKPQEIHIFIAQSIKGRKTPKTKILLEKELTIPLIATHYGRSQDLFKSQAEKITDALWASLPGGTVDALLVEMLDRQRSCLIVVKKGS